uniref:CARDB domain-containing protein n=1 Tax=Acrobeloides nanus TaxID=290746 RepID=A0A914D8T4_9BILA
MTIIDSNTGNELSGQPVSTSSYNFYFGCDLCSAINNVTLKTCQTNQLILPANDQNTTLNYNVANLGTKDDVFGITVTSSNPSFILLVVNTSISVPKGASINGSVTILANGTIGDFSTIE